MTNPNIDYRVYRKIWESGQHFELIGIAESGSYIDAEARLDTNYQYTIVPFYNDTTIEGDFDLNMELNSIIERPVVDGM